MFEKEVYVNRRKQLKALVKSGLVFLPGNTEASMNYSDNCYSFRQDSSFIYFVGLDTPDLFYILDIDNDKEYLFGQELTMDDIIWMGNLPSLKERSFKAGIDHVLPLNDMYTMLERALSAGQNIHYLRPYRYRNQMLLSRIFNVSVDEVFSGFSEKLTKAVVQLRMIKEAVEITELENAAEIGYQMHLTAMQMCKSGISEREIAGRIEGIALAYGNRVSFPTILSQNGQTLHNHDHSGILQTGRLMLTDAGAENVNYYASDFTRTTAVDGKYSSRQKEIHQIVLSAINHSISMIKPGITYQSVHREAYRIIFDGLKELDITKGNTEDALENGVPALFMPHGLGHAMGIDVHDMEDLGEDYVGYDDEIKRSSMFGYRSLRLGRRLQEGFVLTVEPGVYFIPQLIDKWEAEKYNVDFINFSKLKEYYDFGGIRLEDDVIVTKDGSKIISKKRLPITVDEIANAVNS